MASEFNELFLGTAEEVMDILDGKDCTVGELRAALHNAFRKIGQLEKTVASLQAGQRDISGVIAPMRIYGGVKS